MAENKKWRKEAGDFAAFKHAIKEELNTKPPNSEWVVEMEVKKSGNPIHEFRIVLRPRG
jgi:hypothetical protein